MLIKKRDELELDELEIFFTKAGIHAHIMHVGIGILSMLIIVLFGSKSSPIAGFSYALIGPAHGIYWAFMNKKYKAIKKQMALGTGKEE